MRSREYEIERVYTRDHWGLAPLVKMEGAESRVPVLFLPPNDATDPKFALFPGSAGMPVVGVWRGGRAEFDAFVRTHDLPVKREPVDAAELP